MHRLKTQTKENSKKCLNSILKNASSKTKNRKQKNSSVFPFVDYKKNSKNENQFQSNLKKPFENLPTAKAHWSLKTSKTKKLTKIKHKKKKEEVSTFFKELKKCNSKIGLRKIINSLSPFCHELINFYMTQCFIFDIFTRKLKNKSFLLSKRELLFQIFNEPRLLEMDCHFDNNLLKNFCTGMANFFIKHYDQIVCSLFYGRIKEK